MKWLQRHDRESGDLYGMLPLIIGAPYALTDHLDRNPEKQLLRGKIGYLQHWILDTRETSCVEDGYRVLTHLPVVVFIKFPGAKWTLAPLTEPGLYPIRPKPATWFIDKGRQHPVLAVQRRQIPLAPAFAITSHAAQGQTLPAAIVDLQIGRGTNPIASYVAITRVKQRQDLLIFKAFDYDIFTQGPLQGPSLLLRALRGEVINWKEIEESFTPSRQCSGCLLQCYKQEFHLSQFNRKDKRHYCKLCVEHKAKQAPHTSAGNASSGNQPMLSTREIWRGTSTECVWTASKDASAEHAKSKRTCGSSHAASGSTQHASSASEGAAGHA